MPVVDIPLVGGLKEKTASEWIDPTSQTSVTNAVWLQQQKAQSRPGWLRQPTVTEFPTGFPSYGTTALSGALALFPNEDGYAVTDGTFLYDGAVAEGANPALDYVSPCVATRK